MEKEKVKVEGEKLLIHSTTPKDVKIDNSTHLLQISFLPLLFLTLIPVVIVIVVHILKSQSSL